MAAVARSFDVDVRFGNDVDFVLAHRLDDRVL